MLIPLPFYSMDAQPCKHIDLSQNSHADTNDEFPLRLPGHVEHPSLLTSVIKLVLHDHQSQTKDEPAKKTFISGTCIGGTAVLSFLLDYPKYFEGDGVDGIKLGGAYAMAPISASPGL